MGTTEEEGDARLVVTQHHLEANRPVLDKLGRVNLHGFGLGTIIRNVILAAGIPFETIPGEYWTLDTNDDGFSVADVACPCRHTPRVLVGSLDTCECDRAYAFTGTDVYVFNPAKVSLPGLSAAS